jgi:hypothetical protein
VTHRIPAGSWEQIGPGIGVEVAHAGWEGSDDAKTRMAGFLERRDEHLIGGPPKLLRAAGLDPVRYGVWPQPDGSALMWMAMRLCPAHERKRICASPKR